ncbi:MAG: cytochrome b5 domain-containing protein [Deltaproteobacteria bacterium]|nr:cytochrome b5 domain-containing protein [Deltaproteobacteria bacterium]
MSPDPCLAMADALHDAKPWSFLHHMIGDPLRLLGLYTRTNPARMVTAVRKELVDLDHRALASLENQPGEQAEAARKLLSGAIDHAIFPRDDLQTLAAGADPALAEELGVWIEKHRALERRLSWLLDTRGTKNRLPRLDPEKDCDEIWCYVRYAFRPEHVWGLWGNAIERIAQIEATSTFFHSTGEAEASPVRRTEDTAIFYAYFFNWGPDTYHGRKAIERMNQIHGRYFIHNDGMKYVLLNAAFTILDGLELIGHRELSDTERLGYFHAQVNMGKAMNIQGLTHDWDEMYSWFGQLNRLFHGYSPQKRRMFFAIEDAFDRKMKTPKPLTKLRQMFAFAGMDPAYQECLGVRSSNLRRSISRKMFWVAAKLRDLLPPEPDAQSLTTYLTYPDGVDVEDLGVKERSARMPSACPFSGSAIGAIEGRSRAFPEAQVPLLTAGDAVQPELPTVDWVEVHRHDKPDDLWVVFDGHVYDLSAFAKNHPGGLQVLVRGNRKDMTRAYAAAKHTELTKVFALNFRIARIAPAPSEEDPQGEPAGAEAAPA